jgi:hypothetical protein
MVHFQQLVALDFQRLDSIPVFDGLEMLPRVRHGQQKQAAKSDAEMLHLSRSPRVFYFYQS